MSRPLALLVALLALSAASLLGALVVGTFPISALQVLESLAFPAPGVMPKCDLESARAARGCGLRLWRVAGPRRRAAASRPGQTTSSRGWARAAATAIWSIAAAGALLAGACALLVQVATFSTTTAAALALALGAIGLVTPRVLGAFAIMRLRRVLPFAFLLGGSVLTLADAMTRWPEAPWRQVF